MIDKREESNMEVEQEVAYEVYVCGACCLRVCVCCVVNIIIKLEVNQTFFKMAVPEVSMMMTFFRVIRVIRDVRVIRVIRVIWVIWVIRIISVIRVIRVV
jgi:hypothetical protein